MKNILTVCVLIVVLLSCSKEQSCIATLPPDYLDIEHTTPESLSRAEWVSITHAAYRMGMYVDKGSLKYTAKTPEEIRVSPSLFYLLTKIIQEANDKGIFSHRFLLLTKSDDPPLVPLDCVARALSHWGGHSYYEIESWIITQFPNSYGGVPINQINRTIYTFYPDYFPTTPAWVPEGMEFGVTCSVGIYCPGNGYSHMVNIAGIDEQGCYRLVDFQSDSVEFSVSPSTIKYVFFKEWPAVDSSFVEDIVERIHNYYQ